MAIQSENKIKDTHVLIVGAGPVGMMCASKLSHAGIKVTVIELDKEIPPIPKALTYTAPVLADLHKLGVLEEVKKICFADENAVWGWRKLGGDLLAEMHWGLLAKRGDTRLVKPYALQCGQHLLAKVLTEYCSQFPTTTIHFDHALVGLTQDESSVTAEVSPSGGEPFKIKADWVLGCDGGRSATRKFIGQSLEGFSWPESFVAMNIHFPFPKYNWGAANFLIGGKKWAVAGRTGPGSDPWRVAYATDAGKSDEQVIEEAHSRLKDILPGDDPYEIVNCSQYRVHQRQVKEYKVGRVMLAGDAAHLNNPIGGFGLTTGMTDAGCISDALILVIQGKAPETLLQKACDKRREVFATVSNPGSQDFKRMAEQDPNNMSEKDRQFFHRINTDEEFQVATLLGVMRLYTPVEDLLEDGLLDEAKAVQGM